MAFLLERNRKFRGVDEIQCMLTLVDIDCVIAHVLLPMAPGNQKRTFSQLLAGASKSPMIIDQQDAQ
jgi:hypothetical protein